MVSRSEQESDRLRSEHAWCLELKHSHAFAWFLEQVQQRYNVTLRHLTTPNPPMSRDFSSGRLDALGDVMSLVERNYNAVANIVEKVD